MPLDGAVVIVVLWRHMFRALNKKHLTAVVLSFYMAFVAAPSVAEALRCTLFFHTAPSKRSWQNIDKLVFMTFNVANIYGLRGKFTRISATDFTPIYEKPPVPKLEEQVLQLKKAMNDINADIAILTEVESLSALQTLSAEIAPRYKSFLIEGNDTRGIDIGFLVKSDLPIQTEIFSHKDREWTDPVTHRTSPLFSRDLPVMILRKDNEQKPFAMVFGMHAISLRGRPDDIQSTRLRTAQFDGAIKIIWEYRKKFGRDIPVILAGDFNTSVMFAPELKAIRDFTASAFDVALKTIPRAARITHTFHESYIDVDKKTYERNSMDQLDDIRLLGIPPELVLSASVYRYKDVHGNALPFAMSYELRHQQTSDHLPVVVEISREAFD